jgi:Zn-dependent protease with chaperone function
LADVLHKLHTLNRKNDESVAFLLKTHPSPTERIEKLGDLLTPRLSKLPQGLAPALSLR